MSSHFFAQFVTTNCSFKIYSYDAVDDFIELSLPLEDTCFIQDVEVLETGTHNLIVVSEETKGLFIFEVTMLL